MATVTQMLRPQHAFFDPDLASPQLRRINGTNFSRQVLAFDAATDEIAFWDLTAIRYAVTSGTGNLTLRVRWSAASATSGTVVWGAQLAAVTPGDSGALSSKAFATAQTASQAHAGTTADRMHEAVIPISNLDSLANNDHVLLKVYRDADNGSDTMSGDAWLEALVLEYSDL